MNGIITDLTDVSAEDLAYTQMVFREVWDLQEQVLDQGYIRPKETPLLLAIENKTAKKLTQFIDEIKMFAGGDWKQELIHFKEAAMSQINSANTREEIVEDFESLLDTIDWQTATLQDSNENIHQIVLVSEVQVVTQCMDSYFVWHKSSGESLMLGCEDLRIVNKV